MRLSNSISPYPFGMLMGERTFSGEKYRWGFNGQEKDDEVSGNGNSNSAEFWQYDSRLGRRWNIDPKTQINISDFACFGNNPIWFSDVLGDIIEVEGNKRFVRKTNRALSKMQETEEGKRIYDKLHSSENVYTIRKHERNTTKVSAEADLPENWKLGDIGFTGQKWSNGFFMGKGGWLSLGHELGHTEDVEDVAVSDETWQTPDESFSYTPVFHDPIKKTYSYGTPIIVSVPQIHIDEVRAVDRENKMRAQSGILLRSHYNQIVIKSATVPDGEPLIIIRFTQQLVKDGIGTHPSYNTNYNLLKKKK